MELLILGASARSAAFSALRLGLRPTSGDLFGDADLAATGPSTRVEPGEYPEGLARLADRIEPMPWIYTGAVENRPDLVDRISMRHRLLGNPGEVLRAVRDPLALAEVARGAGLAAPKVRLDPSGLPTDGSWLVKPLASGGGRGIRLLDGRARPEGRSVYYQERVEGLPLSALFVGERGGARSLGVSRQFVGKPGNRFAYRGSLAPWPVPDEVSGRIERLGAALGSRFGLAGLFGVDLILKDDHPQPIEVNPRYTASVEVLEWALGRSLLLEHLVSCGLESLASPMKAGPAGFVGKAIVHADRSLRWPEDLDGRAIDPGVFPEIADVPRPGTSFRAGEPVLSVFAQGDSPEFCRRALASAVLRWRRNLRNRASS